MISKLAKSTIEKWWSEGLKPSFEEIITLNSFGCKCESGTDAVDLAMLPRVAFLGDYIMHEPTVAKCIWIDRAMQIVSNGTDKLMFYAWALLTPDDELCGLNDRRKIEKNFRDFFDTVLIGFTFTQIEMAVDYVLNGDNDETLKNLTDDEKKTREEVTYPEQGESVAKALLCQAITYGISEDVKYDATNRDL